ncbi:hypothetical protein QCA50_014254 [Cerrena zonata]|uniref:Uncharacterized protein n=1 Tax=Cerrena zonata TaxID=2478898 RepID=A0AAW0FBB8_9APHY
MSYPNEDLPFDQLSLKEIVYMYRNSLRELIALGDHAKTSDRAKFANTVLCGRWGDPPARLSLNGMQDAGAVNLNHYEITRDFDSVIGITDNLPYTHPLAIFPVPPFRETLTQDVHLSGPAFLDAATKGPVPLHTIPNLAFAKVNNRHIARLFLPKLYATGEKKVPTTILRSFYNTCTREVVREVCPEHIAHWPHDYTSATTQYRDLRGHLHFCTLDLPPHRIRTFGQLLLEKVRAKPWGEDAYFVHQLRGTKDYTIHGPQAQEHMIDALDDLLLGIDPELVEAEPDSWWGDVGIEVRSPGKVLQWLTEGHANLLRHILPEIPEDQIASILRQPAFKPDMAAQIRDYSGFRYHCRKRIQEATNVHYINAYTTDKSPFYQLHAGLFRRRKASDLLPSNIDKLLDDLERGQDILSQCGGIPVDGEMEAAEGPQEGAVRIEVRVPLIKFGQVLATFPPELIQTCIVRIKPEIWWQFKYYRHVAILIVVTYMSRCRASRRREKPYLTLGAILIYMLNALHYRPARGQAEDKLVLCCCQRVADGSGESDSDEEDEPNQPRSLLVPILYKKGIYNIAGIIMRHGDARIHVFTTVSDHSLSFFYNEPSLTSIQAYFGVHHQIAGTTTRINPNRNPNKRVRTHEIQLDDVPAEQRVDFRLAERGVVVEAPPPRRGPDIDALTDMDVDMELLGFVPNPQPISVNDRVELIWHQFPRDIISKGPNERGESKPSYLCMSGEAIQAATIAIFNTRDMRDIFVRVQWRQADTKTWDETLFRRYFPPADAQIPTKFQNFRNCVYWQNWRQLIAEMTPTNAIITTACIKAKFDTLLWLPFASADRLWTTKLSRNVYQFLPSDEPARAAPQIVFNPRRVAQAPLIRSAEDREDVE